MINWVVEYIGYAWFEIKSQPWYLRPLYTLLWCIFFIDDILNIQIRIWPRKFKTWDNFELHLEKIKNVLWKNNELVWADKIHDAQYISQSSLEIMFALLDVLKPLCSTPLSKKLGLRQDLKKAITYIYSFRTSRGW